MSSFSLPSRNLLSTAIRCSTVISSDKSTTACPPSFIFCASHEAASCNCRREYKRNIYSHQASSVVGTMVGITWYPIVSMNVILRFKLGCTPKDKEYYRISLSWFSCGSLSCLNWNLKCWFLWRKENWRTQQKTLEARRETNNKLNPHVTRGRNRNQATLLSSLCHPCSPKDSKNLTHCKIKENYSALVWINLSSTKLMTFYNAENVLSWQNTMHCPIDTTPYMLERAWNLSSLSRHTT